MRRHSAGERHAFARREHRRRKHRGAVWTCPECGVGKAEADRRRHRRGLPELAGDAQACSPECGAPRKPPALAGREGHAGARDATHLPAEADVSDELLDLWEFPESFDLGR
jgi:hypothetical protein